MFSKTRAIVSRLLPVAKSVASPNGAGRAVVRKVLPVAKYAAVPAARFVLGRRVVKYGLAITTIGIAAAKFLPEIWAEEAFDTEDDESIRVIQAREILKHDKREDCWIAIEGKIYDVTDFLERHPGGAGWLLQYAGKDATQAFKPVHPKGTIQRTLSESSIVGFVDPTTSYLLDASAAGFGESEEERQKRRNELPPLDSIQNLKQFEEMAERVLGKQSSSMVFYRSVAEDGVAFAKNLNGWSYLQFRPRVLVPVEDISVDATLLTGQPPSPLPIFMSPAARAGVGHPDGERTLVRGAAETGITQCISSAASITLDEIFEEKRSLKDQGRGDAKTWFQLYFTKDVKVTEARVKEAVAGGCTAILLTVDLPVLGKRESDPASRAGLNGATTWSVPYNANMTFDVIPQLKAMAPGVPILIKGVATPEDVELAYQHGAAGVLLSNHGGRQLDGAPPPVATLVRIRQTKPYLLDDAPGFSVLVDCGVRRGSDVLKALCLGAKGVGLGRPFLFAQAAYGEKGVVRAIQILEEEIHIGMRLLGARSIADLKPSMLELLPGLVGQDL